MRFTNEIKHTIRMGRKETVFFLQVLGIKNYKFKLEAVRGCKALMGSLELFAHVLR